MQKQVYVSPEFIVHGNARTITLGQGGTAPGNSQGHGRGLSCGNGNVFGPSDCGHNTQTHDDHGNNGHGHP